MIKAHPISRALAFVLILASLGMLFLPWVTVSYRGESESESYYEFIEEAVESIEEYGFDEFMESKGATLFLIATILLLVTAILSIILAACGLRGGGIPFFVGTLPCLAFAIYFVTDMNKKYGMNLLHIGYGAILCVAFALAAMILLFIPDNSGGYGGVRVGYGGYGGGAPARPVSAACTCPNCGSPLRRGESFCPNCGARV